MTGKVDEYTEFDAGETLTTLTQPRLPVEHNPITRDESANLGFPLGEALKHWRILGPKGMSILAQPNIPQKPFFKKDLRTLLEVTVLILH